LGLATDNPGLCVVTTRETLANLRTYRNSTAPEKQLDKLLREAAIALLRHLQIVGTEEELTAAWRDAGGHALTLQLLGRFIADAFPDRDIRHRAEVKFEAADLERQGRSAFKVMLAYERWLEGAGPERQRELAILRLTGLFDRPISADCLSALRAAPAIPGLTDTIVPLTDAQWNTALRRLESIELISMSSVEQLSQLFGAAGTVGTTVLHSLDAHPLIREYFAAQLREQQGEAFRAAHSRLFDHLCEHTEHQPDTLDGLQPLYQAVVHGCLAGRQQEARDKVYRDRILRGTGPAGFYSSNKLGAIGADLAAVAAFFDQPWSRLSPNMSAAAQAWLLHEAALRLRALGRLTEALEPMRETLEINADAEQWKNAAVVASNLSGLEVTLGRLGDAVADARRAIDLADRSGDLFQRMGKRTTAADALHQSGERDEARALFEQAEVLERERQPEFDLLCSLPGFDYCDLLLAPAERAVWQVMLPPSPDVAGKHQPLGASAKNRNFIPRKLLAFPRVRSRNTRPPTALPQTASTIAGNGITIFGTSPRLTGQTDGEEPDASAFRLMDAALAEAERRATSVQKRRTGLPTYTLLDIALDHLTLARVALYRAILEHPNQKSNNPHLAPALNGLRQAGIVEKIPLALLTAALHHHVMGDASAARRDLDEAQQIAERGPMPLCLADIHLCRARLGMNNHQIPITNVQESLAIARQLIQNHNYGRRYEELADAEAALANQVK
jgi:tetratricopeptide (TPR) repeat protein